MKKYFYIIFTLLLFLNTSCDYKEKLFTTADYKQMGSPSELVIPVGYTAIDSIALVSNNNITLVSIPKSMRSIGYGAFADCQELSEVLFDGKSLMHIGEGAFAHCTNLVSIAIPNSVKMIGKSAFYECTKLSQLRIGNSV